MIRERWSSKRLQLQHTHKSSRGSDDDWDAKAVFPPTHNLHEVECFRCNWLEMASNSFVVGSLSSDSPESSRRHHYIVGAIIILRSTTATNIAFGNSKSDWLTRGASAMLIAISSGVLRRCYILLAPGVCQKSLFPWNTNETRMNI